MLNRSLKQESVVASNDLVCMCMSLCGLFLKFLFLSFESVGV